MAILSGGVGHISLQGGDRNVTGWTGSGVVVKYEPLGICSIRATWTTCWVKIYARGRTCGTAQIYARDRVTCVGSMQAVTATSLEVVRDITSPIHVAGSGTTASYDVPFLVKCL